MFTEIEKCQEFDFDYVQNLDDLPLGKLISLCAQTDNDDKSLKSAMFQNNQKVLFSSIVANKETDKIWKIQEKILNFRVRNMLGATIEIANKENEIFLYNLKKLDTLNYKDPKAQMVQLNLKQKIQAFIGKKVAFSEYVIMPETHVVFVGVLKKDFKGNFRLEPKVISGENRSLFLKCLDEHIVAVNGKGKKIFYTFFAVVILESIRKMLYRANLNKKKVK